MSIALPWMWKLRRATPRPARRMAAFVAGER